ncbi:MAG: glycosyltransferase family 4 protein [Ruminococcus flavefaciens]|nr:glycosyltransferase family 4 protein [Bacteroides sp.]MCM1233516.1 glycosyltransferase family 4 protein [Ruminococcus flavefaciens]
MSKSIYIVVTPFFPTPENWRGPFVLDQVKAIQRNSDYEVIVLRPAPFLSAFDSYEYDGVRVHFFPFISMPSGVLNGLPNKINGSLFMKSLKRLDIDENNVKVVHSHTASLACCSATFKKYYHGVKSVLQYHDPDPFGIRNGSFTDTKWNNTIKAKLLIQQFEHIDLHLCISRKVEYNLIHFPNAAPDECYESYKNALSYVKSVAVPNLNTYILHNGVDIRSFNERNKQKSKIQFQIGSIANFADWKDQITLIKAIELIKNKIPNLKVVLIGSGPEYGSCLKYIQQHNLTEIIEFRKELHHCDLGGFYNTLDLFVLPSFFEGFGCVFLEAYACGVPFITCKGQGMDDYIAESDADKWLIEPKDAFGLSEKIFNYYANRYVQTLIDEFDIDKIISKYIQFIS